MARSVRATVAAFGLLDVMVNNAATIAVEPVVETSVATWDHVLEVNLRGVFLGCREAARQMIAQGEGGWILNCSSGAGRRGGALVGAYTASTFVAYWLAHGHAPISSYGTLLVAAIVVGLIVGPLIERDVSNFLVQDDHLFSF